MKDWKYEEDNLPGQMLMSQIIIMLTYIKKLRMLLKSKILCKILTCPFNLGAFDSMIDFVQIHETAEL